MTPRVLRRAPLAVAAALICALFVFPFFIAAAPCEQRLSAYTWAGAAVLVAVVLVPFAAPGCRLIGSRWGSALILAGLCAGVWIAGLVSADVRLVCRLF